MSKRSSDLDNDHTDELPVLLETVALDDGGPALAEGRGDDTSQNTALYAHLTHVGAAEPVAELTRRAEQLPALEAQIRVLTDSARELEFTLRDKDRLIAELKDTLRRSGDDAVAAERRAAVRQALSDGRTAELTSTIERLQREAAEREGMLDGLRAETEAVQRETESLRQELAARSATEEAAASAESLREDNAALTAYIAGRRAWWDERAGLAERAGALERELADGTKRLAAAEAYAARESQRAVGLRAELVDYARRVESLEAELRAARSLDPHRLGSDGPEFRPEVPRAPEPPARRESAGAPAPEAAADATEPATPAAEAIGQLEAELEYKRQQVAAQLVELREREQRLLTAADEVERARRERGALQTALEEMRASVARLERAVLDKDRALDARDARIAALQEELKQRTGTPRPALELATRHGDSGTVRVAAHDATADGLSGPALLCLTGDAPKRFALTKKTITVGRGPQCDLQILTHFVSREHARLTLSGGGTLIEDLGSRNGVFVNSIRVERRHLQQGDLVTIGETQFRFVESMAH